MADGRLRVTQDWQRHFDAPVALLGLSAGSNDAILVDEDGWLRLIDMGGTCLLEKQLPWVPSAAAVDEDGHSIALMSPSGALVVLDRNGRARHQSRCVWRPLSIDISPDGSHVAFIDGSGRLGVLGLAGSKPEISDARGPFYYVKFLAPGTAVLAVGQYGQVAVIDDQEARQWEKEYRCHTRMPAASAGGEMIFIPSPHYGVIALRRDGRDIGVFEVPGSPRGVAVSADAATIFAVSERSELLIFTPDGRLRFRQPLSAGVAHFACDSQGRSITAVMTSGAASRFSVVASHEQRDAYLELGHDGSAPRSAPGPSVLWRAKVFSALGGPRGGQLAVTPGARHVALLDIEARLRIFDRTGAQAGNDEKIQGRQPMVKAARSADFVVAASSDTLLALDLRGYRQRRIALKNEWTTQYDIAPSGIFFAVADFFQGISLFDESFNRAEYLETASEVLDLAVDGRKHTLTALAAGALAFFNDRGALIRSVPYPVRGITALSSLAQGFVAASGSRLDAFASDGRKSWSSEFAGEVIGVAPVRNSLVVSTSDGHSFITNPLGTVVSQIMRRAHARFFPVSDADGADDVGSVECRGNVITARSSRRGVLWRQEMDDEIVAMEVSPDGRYVAVLAGIFLQVLSTTAGAGTAQESLYLEI